MSEKERNCAGAYLWARGYAVSIAGFDEEIMLNCIKKQNKEEEGNKF